MRLPIVVVVVVVLGATTARGQQIAANLPVVVFPPSAKSQPGQQLAVVMQDRASSLLEQSGRYLPGHAKQVERMAEGEGLDPHRLDEGLARAVATHLGAIRYAFGDLIENADGTWKLRHGGRKRGDAAADSALLRETELPADWSKAVELGGHLLASDVAELDGIPLPPGKPMTASDAAMRAYAACFSSVVRQPIGIESPTTLLVSELRDAVSACRRAVEADPAFAEAWASLALAQAIQGDDADAIAGLARSMGTGVYLPLRSLARFWLVTRYQSSEAGTRVLADALSRHPRSPLLLGYLAEQFVALNQPAAALEAWRAYLAASPQNPFVLAQMAATLDKLGRMEDAIDKARESTRLDPSSRSRKVDLAVRYLDAGRFEKAVVILEAIATDKAAQPEAMVTLGRAKLQLGDLDGGDLLLKLALARASRPDQWRTRGRADFNLAKSALRRGQRETAHRYVLDALDEGYRPSNLHRDDPELEVLTNDIPQRGAVLQPKPRAGSKLHPPEASPFSVTPGGEIDPNEGRPPPPAGFEILRFDL